MPSLVPKNLNAATMNMLVALENRLRVSGTRVCDPELNYKIFDFGIDGLGTLAGGLLLAEICMAGLGDVSLVPNLNSDLPFGTVCVRTDYPLAACVAAQYAGWPIVTSDYFAMASGPGRLLRGREEILNKYALKDSEQNAVLVLESSLKPTKSATQQICEACDVSQENLILCMARTASLAGTVQIVARSVETTMHKLDQVGIDLRHVNSAIGWAPMPPIGKNDLQSIGWTNDAIIFGAQVVLTMETDDKVIEQFGPQIPSNSSSDFGRPFREIFDAYDRDFYKIDKSLFSPAQVTINNVKSGRTWVFGKQHVKLLQKSFGI